MPGRRSADYVATEGRDKGKTFVLTERPASQVEWWAARAYMALEKAGIDVGNVAAHGAQGLMVLGVKGLAMIPPYDLKPLLDEMMTCVQVREAIVRPLIDDGTVSEDIEEIATRIALRTQIAQLHLGFSLAAGLSTSAKPERTQTPSASSNTQMSPPQSARRFHPNRQPLKNSASSTV